jgi:hypothetical protein
MTGLGRFARLKIEEYGMLLDDSKRFEKGCESGGPGG